MGVSLTRGFRTSVDLQSFANAMRMDSGAAPATSGVAGSWSFYTPQDAVAAVQTHNSQDKSQGVLALIVGRTYWSMVGRMRLHYRVSTRPNLL